MSKGRNSESVLVRVFAMNHRERVNCVGSSLRYTIGMYSKEGQCGYQNGAIVWRCGCPRQWSTRSISKKATRSRFELRVSGCSRSEERRVGKEWVEGMVVRL